LPKGEWRKAAGLKPKGYDSRVASGIFVDADLKTEPLVFTPKAFLFGFNPG